MLHSMARRVSSDNGREDGAGIWAVRAGDPKRVAPVNNPLAVIMGYARLLADQVDAHGQGQIEEILEARSRIQAIVAQMQRVTRVELTEEAPHLPEMLDLKRSSDFHRRP